MRTENVLGKAHGSLYPNMAQTVHILSQLSSSRRLTFCWDASTLPVLGAVAVKEHMLRSDINTAPWFCRKASACDLSKNPQIHFSAEGWGGTAVNAIFKGKDSAEGFHVRQFSDEGNLHVSCMKESPGQSEWRRREDIQLSVISPGWAEIVILSAVPCVSQVISYCTSLCHYYWEFLSYVLPGKGLENLTTCTISGMIEFLQH